MADAVAGCCCSCCELKGSDRPCRGDVLESGGAFSFWGVPTGGSSAAAASAADTGAFSLEDPAVSCSGSHKVTQWLLRCSY